MRKIIIFILFGLLFPINTYALETSAHSVIVMDQDSHRILYSKNINDQRSVASISKIMTGILACESGKLENQVKIGDEINTAYGSGIYIKKGEKLLLKDLTYGLMLRSGNDAALAIANYVGGSVDDFIDMMNLKAIEIGMKNTIFNNPSGLDEDKGNYSTAYDMALLTSYAMKNKDYRKIVGTKKYKLTTNKNTYSWTNKNKLLFRYKYITGGKTGFTKIARRTLVSTATKNKLNLVIVTLNDGNDFDDHQKLYEEFFSKYHNYTILKKDNIKLDNDSHYKNKNVYTKNDVIYPLTESEKDIVTVKYHINKNKKISGEIGYLDVMLGDEVVLKEKLYVKGKFVKIKESFIDRLKKLW